MNNLAVFPKIDYLVIGHLTHDVTPHGLRLGGTAAYSALTAQALGLRAGIVTAWNGDQVAIPDAFSQIPIVSYPTEESTTFENLYTEHGRIQTVRTVAPRLDYYLVPESWRQPLIVHLGPVAQEVEPGLVRRFPSSLVGLTPQGWLRSWDQQGHIQPAEWPEGTFTLQQAGAAVISNEDVGFDEERIEEMAAACRVLAVTEGKDGTRLYWNGDVRRFRAPTVQEIDATRAGDIFAAAFFARLYSTRDPWESARFATQLAAYSVTRSGLEKIPTAQEIRDCMVEVI